MAAEVESGFAKDQKALVKRAMKGRPLYFGLQAKAAKSGKFVLSKKPGDVKANAIKELKIYEGKDAEKQNTIPGGASMGVAKGGNGILTLYFERGKALPVAENLVKYFVTRLLKCKAVKKVIIAETDQLPAVPESSDQDSFTATPESLRERADGLLERMKKLSGDQSRLEGLITTALQGANGNPSASDDMLDDVEFFVTAYERLASLEQLLSETEKQPGVAAEVVDSIRTKRLQVARQQLDGGQGDEADENLDVAEQSIANLRGAAGLPPKTVMEESRTADPVLNDTQAPSTVPSPPATGQQNQADEYRRRLEQITPGFKHCLQNQRGDTGKMRSVFAWTQAQAEAAQTSPDLWQKALQGLDSLRNLIAEGPDEPATTVPDGLVDKRKFMLTRMRQLPVEIRPHLTTLGAVIRRESPDEDVDTLLDAVDGELNILFDALRNEIDKSITAGDPSQLRGLKSRVLRHPVVRHLAGSPLMDGTPFQAVVIAALDEIETNLAG